jgi:hypothetical protein
MKTYLSGIAVVVISLATPAIAACVPPPGFVDPPHPEVAPVDDLVSHTEDIVIARPLTSVLKIVQAMTLADTVRRTKGLPGITGTYLLTKNTHTFGAPGSRQFDCLSDGSTLEEESLERAQDAGDYRFRYVVWNYTTPQARPIRYGMGDFHYTSPDATHTRVHWTYSFALNRWHFPGFLGPLGDYLFRVGFLDHQYADLMKSVLQGYKTNAERINAKDAKVSRRSQRS